MCDVVQFGEGGFAIVCGRRQRPRKCALCGRAADKLCDWPRGKNGKTCDKPLCSGCAVSVGPDRDYCPTHPDEAAMASDWPKTGEELKAEGYRFERWGECRGCKARVAWTNTPNQHMMPLVEIEQPPLGAPLGTRWFQPHFADCPKGASWSKRGSRSRGSRR